MFENVLEKIQVLCSWCREKTAAKHVTSADHVTAMYTNHVFLRQF
jgi:hypothetical protein